MGQHYTRQGERAEAKARKAALAATGAKAAERLTREAPTAGADYLRRQAEHCELMGWTDAAKACRDELARRGLVDGADGSEVA